MQFVCGVTVNNINWSYKESFATGILYYYCYCCFESVMITSLLCISLSDYQMKKWQNTSADERLSLGYFQLSKKWKVQDISQEGLSLTNLLLYCILHDLLSRIFPALSFFFHSVYASYFIVLLLMFPTVFL